MTVPGTATDRPLARPVHALSVDQVATLVDVDPATGLTDAEAARRRAVHGENVLPEAERRGRWRRLLDQLRNGMVVLLAAAAVVSLLIGEPLNAVVIGAIVVLNTVLGFWQEGRAASAAEAVRSLLSPFATVLRGGRAVRIAACDVVPGDVVVLRGGDRIPADGRVATATALEVDESALTGESLPTAKAAGPPAAPGAPLADRGTMGYTGTTVTRGAGTLLVTATGPAGEIAGIARVAEGASEQRTPLQLHLDRLASTLMKGSLAIAAALAVLVWIHGESVGDSLLVGVALAVAAIPEGLPAVVTVALAVGMRKLADEGAVVRRLPAVETLGSTTTICTDKTGTLTENRMAVAEVAGVDGHDAADVLAAALVCSELAADPGERAIALAARERGVGRDAALGEGRVVDVIGFDAARKRMSAVVDGRQGRRSYVKGAPEVVGGLLARPEPELDDLAAEWAAGGLRVLLVAGRELGPADDPESQLEPIGLIAMADPPRASVPAAVATAAAAGVRTVMITGDHPVTASAIARACGIGSRVLTGAQLDGLDAAQLAARVGRTDVFARVAPEHKQRIVDALRADGEIVAMTGDGINDIPGLASADIGVAMGRGGTDAAAQAADMVLTDDDYGTIVAAIRVGRAVYDDILRFTQFLVAGNLGEVLVFAVAIVLGYPAPLAVLQILLVNLLTDGMPAVALGFDPPEPGVMRRPPRPPRQSLLRPLLPDLALGGLATGAAVLASFLIGHAAGADAGRTMAFTTLVFGRLAYVFAVRGSGWASQAGSNRLLAAAVLASAAIATAVLVVAPLADAFSAVALSPAQVAAALGLALVPFACAEAAKARRRRSSSRR
jgi:P-type Ca2+ transporter type 2C